MFFRPCFKRREMDSRRAPVSKEVRRPETSRREIGPAWRMVTEKFVGCTVRTPLAGEVILPVRGKPCAENFYAKEDRCGPGSVHRCARNLSPAPIGASPRARSQVPERDNSRAGPLLDEFWSAGATR